MCNYIHIKQIHQHNPDLELCFGHMNSPMNRLYCSCAFVTKNRAETQH